MKLIGRFQRSLLAAKGKSVRAWQDYKTDILEGHAWLKYVGYVGVLYLVIVFVLGFIWSSEPEHFDVEDYQAFGLVAAETQSVTGLATVNALVGVADTLLDKPGGYLSNDITFPGLMLDNIPNWEYGVLIQVRDLARVLRESYSRSQSQSTEDKALKEAEAQFNFDNQSWILPATEDEYGLGIKSLREYAERLVNTEQQEAQFFARADNLRYWLGTVETRLGSLSQNLSASVGQRRLNTDLAGDTAAKQATETPIEIELKTPWTQIDDVFYQARGSAWALIHFLKAVEVDFADVLAKKNALVSMQQIIRELEGTQQQLYSPMILNGSGFGPLANHSLVMANYISRANAAIIDLRELLKSG